MLPPALMELDATHLDLSLIVPRCEGTLLALEWRFKPSNNVTPWQPPMRIEKAEWSEKMLGSDGSEGTRALTGSAIKFRVQNLQPQTSYDVQVRAKSHEGRRAGPWTSALTATTLAKRSLISTSTLTSAISSLQSALDDEKQIRTNATAFATISHSLQILEDHILSVKMLREYDIGGILRDLQSGTTSLVREEHVRFEKELKERCKQLEQEWKAIIKSPPSAPSIKVSSSVEGNLSLDVTVPAASTEITSFVLEFTFVSLSAAEPRCELIEIARDDWHGKQMGEVFTVSVDDRRKPGEGSLIRVRADGTEECWDAQGNWSFPVELHRQTHTECALSHFGEWWRTFRKSVCLFACCRGGLAPQRVLSCVLLLQVC